MSNVLEGSVQKVGDRVHINVQLIQAGTDAHLWAQSYDRQLTDIFGVEGEVAKSIADSLQRHAFAAGKSARRNQTDDQCRRLRALFAGPRLSNAT